MLVEIVFNKKIKIQYIFIVLSNNTF